MCFSLSIYVFFLPPSLSRSLNHTTPCLQPGLSGICDWSSSVTRPDSVEQCETNRQAGRKGHTQREREKDRESEEKEKEQSHVHRITYSHTHPSVCVCVCVCVCV